MSLVQFLSQLKAANIQIFLDENRLRYQAPQGAMTGELLAELKTRRMEIIDFLKQVNPYSTIEPAPELSYYPATFAQRRLYILSQLEGAEISYNISGATRIEGELEPERLAAAFQKLIQRHEVFRTTFAMVEGELVQRIHPQAELPYEYLDLEESENVRNGLHDRSLSMPQIIRQFIRPFDLSRAPLLRIKLLKVAPGQYILLYDMHHIISDLMSMSVMVREFTKFYHQESLPELRIQYKDFAFWQSNSGRATIQKQEQYWLETFAGEIPQLDLPTDYPRPAVMNFQGGAASFGLDEALTGQLRQLAIERKTTLFMTLLAGYNLFLARLSGAREVIVGTTVAGRRDAELENIIGMFVNTLPLKNFLDFSQTFAEFLEQVGQNTLNAFENQDYQYEMLLEKLKIPIDLSRNPLFSTLFNPQTDFNAGNYQFEVNGLKFTPYELDNQTNTFAFDLMILISETQHTVHLNCIYRTSLFKPSTLEYLMNEYLRLLREIALDPDKLLQDYRVFNPHDLRPAKPPIPIAAPYEEFEEAAARGSIVERFEDQVRQYPHQIAVKVGSATLEFQALNQRANQLARQIRDKQKVSRPVALLFNCSPEMITGVMGVLKAGQAYVPLDPAYPKERLAYMLSDSGAALMVTDPQNVSLAAELSKKAGKKTQVIDLSKVNRKLSADNLNLAIPPEQVAYIKYTSGSTGRPKGIPQTHRNVLAFIRRFTNELHINPADKAAMFSSYSHSAGGIDIFSMLLNGGTLYPFDLKSEGNFRKIADWLITEGITIFHSVPMVYRYCTDSLKETEQFGRVRLVVLGGEPILAKDGERLRRYFGKDCVLVNMFGATEVIIGTFGIINGVAPITGAQVPIGYPVEEAQIYLVDEQNREVPVFGVGEIIYESDYLALDYLNLPEKSAQSYTTNPFTGKGRVFRSGDLGRILPDGRLEFLGRKDFQVKIRGYRIELGEIEAVLDDFPGIHQSVVAGFEKAEGDYYLAAYYTAAGTDQPERNELRRFMGQKLPDYMIPSYFIQLEHWPLTPNGKIDRKSLPEPDPSGGAGVAYEAPRNKIEAKLAEIWGETLGIEKIGIDDNFFDLGGHSLNATQVILKIHQEFKVELSLREIFNAPVLKELAALITNREENIDTAIEPAAPEDSRPDEGESVYIMAQIWAEAFGLAEIDIQQSFFDLGGNPLIAAQLSGQAKQSGLLVSAQDILSYQTIAGICAHLNPRMRASDTPIAPFHDIYYVNCLFLIFLCTVKHFQGSIFSFMANDYFVYNLKPTQKGLSLELEKREVIPLLELATHNGLNIEISFSNNRGVIDNIIETIIDSIRKGGLVILSIDAFYHKHRHHDIFYFKEHHYQYVLVYGFDIERGLFKIIEADGYKWNTKQCCYPHEISFQNLVTCYQGILDLGDENVPALIKVSKVNSHRIMNNHPHFYKNTLIHNLKSHQTEILQGLSNISILADQAEPFNMNQSNCFDIMVSSASNHYKIKSILGDQGKCLPLMEDITQLWLKVQDLQLRVIHWERFRPTLRQIAQLENLMYEELFAALDTGVAALDTVCDPV